MKSLVWTLLYLTVMIIVTSGSDEANEELIRLTDSRLRRSPEYPGHVLLQLTKTSKKKVLDISGLDCSLCKYGVDFLKGLIHSGFSPKHITELASAACSVGRIQDKEVCSGMSHEYQKEVITVLSKTTYTPEQICAVVLGDTCGQTSGPQFNWTIPLSPKPSVTPPPPPGSGLPTMKVLQLSDIHFDPLYSEGSPADCKEPLCCRNDSTPKGHSAGRAGRWGDYRNCDIPLWTFEHMLHEINKTKFDYVLWTGDLPPHDIWKQTKDTQISWLNLLMVYLKKYFPQTPVLPALGNHESAPVDSFPPPYVTGKDSITWLYSTLSKEWSYWLPNDTMPTLNKGAFYTVLFRPGFRIISVNMNYCNNYNWWLLLNTTDPAGELQWLVTVLQHAEDNNERVHIIGHIPPGWESCLKTWSRNYYSIIDRYSHIIAAQFFGHTHKDHFEVSYAGGNLSQPNGIMYISPSVTLYSFLNPGYRVYTIDGDRPQSTRYVLNHETYIADITQANRQSQPIWVKEYDAMSAFGMDSLLPGEWDKLVTRMNSNTTLFNTFYKFYHKSAPNPACEGVCRQTILCSLRMGRSHDQSFCSNLLRTNRRYINYGLC